VTVRAILNGILACKALYAPVGIVTATSRKDFTFKTLHKTCGSPIAKATQCPVCQADNLGMEDLVKGFEFSKKQYVEVDPAVMATLIPQRSPKIEINKFVSFSDVDDLQVEKSYYLEPNSVLVRPYQLIADAMGNKEAVGIGTSALWGKEYPSMVWTRESGVMVLSLLYCHDELVSDVPITEHFGLVPQEEQEMADMIVATMLRDLEPGDLTSKSRTRMDEYVSSLIAGQEFATEDEDPEVVPTMDVTAALEMSLALAREAA
jgi:DNA end-binding protein Ku